MFLPLCNYWLLVDLSCTFQPMVALINHLLTYLRIVHTAMNILKFKSPVILVLSILMAQVKTLHTHRVYPILGYTLLNSINHHLKRKFLQATWPPYRPKHWSHSANVIMPYNIFIFFHLLLLYALVIATVVTLKNWDSFSHSSIMRENK